MSDSAAFHPLGGSNAILPLPGSDSPALQIQSEYQPAGDQPQAIAEPIENLLQGRDQVLLNTGSGKTFTMRMVQNVQRPTLVLAPNKTLAAQLYAEMKSFFRTTRQNIASY